MVRVEIWTEGQPPRYANLSRTSFQEIKDILQNPSSLYFLLETGDTLILGQYQLDRTVF